MAHLEHLEHLDSDEGNTISSSVKRVTPAKRWCFTLNNYTSEEMDRLEHLFTTLECQWLWGEEVGDEGTPHLQGYVEFPTRKRPIETIGIKRIHWEKCKGSARANVEYVTKDGTNIKGNMQYNKPLRLIARADFYEWQEELVKKLEVDCEEDREIQWLYDEKGCCGKTCIAKWIHAKLPGVMIAGGKGSDIRHMVAARIEKTGLWPKIVIWNIPRTLEQFVSYEAIEQVKDGLFASGKYEGAEVNMNPPHIVVFSNFYPDTAKMSEDRWVIREL